LHVTNVDKTDTGNSLVSANPSASRIGDAMFEGIANVLDELSVSVDWVICPGDLGDQAEKPGLDYAWRKLEELRQKVGADYLIGTAGNHDLDSRLITGGFNPKENLQALSPKFPGVTQADCDQYWGRNWCSYTKDNVRIVNVNSSAYHGFKPKEGEPEHSHGRVSTMTIEDICKNIKGDEFDINILLTHHHVLKNDHIYDNDNSEMSGAGKLIEKLAKTTQSPWMVIHGHQHFPEIDYGRGSSLAPIIMSAGSFSARLSGMHALASPNQFYLVELADPCDEYDGWFPCGIVRAWHWTPSEEWHRSPLQQRIPYGAGFGCKMNPTQSVQRLLGVLDAAEEPFITLGDVYSAEPQLEFLLPTDLELVISSLEKEGIKVGKALNAEDTTFRRRAS